MAEAVTQKEAVKRIKGFPRVMARIKASKEENEKRLGTVIGAAEASGSAFLVRYLREQAVAEGDEFELLGMEPELLIGGVALLGGLLEVAGKYSDHLTYIGIGLTATWAGDRGAQYAQDKNSEDLGLIAPTGGLSGRMGAGSPSQARIARDMARQAAAA